MSQTPESGSWFSWIFPAGKDSNNGTTESGKVGYHRMDDFCRLDGSPSRPSAAHVTQRSTNRVEDVYGYGYSTYQMATIPEGEEYDLQLKRKDKKPSVNSLWARLKYWVRYTWQMFKVGLLASGPGMTSGPMMAPPPMVSMTSRTTRHRFAKEGPMPDVFM